MLSAGHWRTPGPFTRPASASRERKRLLHAYGAVVGHALGDQIRGHIVVVDAEAAAHDPAIAFAHVPGEAEAREIFGHLLVDIAVLTWLVIIGGMLVSGDRIIRAVEQVLRQRKRSRTPPRSARLMPPPA